MIKSIALRIVILLVAISACIYVPWLVGNKFFTVWVNGNQEGASWRIIIATWILGIFLLVFIFLIIIGAVRLFSIILPIIARWVKTGSFSIALISCLFFVGCSQPIHNDHIADKSTLDYGINITTVTVDSCEYIVAEEFQHAISIIHKQNCKFCAERNKTK